MSIDKLEAKESQLYNEWLKIKEHKEEYQTNQFKEILEAVRVLKRSVAYL